MTAYIYLFVAIISEVIATMALRATEGFIRLVPSKIVVIGYGLSFYFLSLTLRSINIGVTYAIWSGVGIVLIATLGFLIYGQKLDLPALFGMGLIVVGVVVMNVFSKTTIY